MFGSGIKDFENKGGIYENYLYLKTVIQDPNSLHIFAARLKNDININQVEQVFRLAFINKQTDEN